MRTGGVRDWDRGDAVKPCRIVTRRDTLDETVKAVVVAA
jgi:hypothetical protein